MPNLREIKTHMKSIRDTKQITSAMYMIASSKMQKAKKNLENTMPYFDTLRDSITCILSYVPNIRNLYFHNLEDIQTQSGRCAYIIITADKGMAGAYNLNVLKESMRLIENCIDPKVYIVGEVGRHFFLNKNVKIEENFDFSATNPTINRARRITGHIIEDYENGELDEVYIIYTRLCGNSGCETVSEQLLPLKHSDFTQLMGSDIEVGNGEMKFFPSADEVISTIVPNYIAGYIFGAMTEAFCSEQNSRMTAMQSANDSANEMLRELEIKYNRARQAAITQEINEVVGGAKVLKQKKQKKEGELYE